MNTGRNFRTDFAVLKQAAKEVSTEQNLPTLSYQAPASAEVVPLPATDASPVAVVKSTSEKKVRAARKTGPSVQKRIALDMPVYLIKAIAEDALERDVTRRYLFLEAFRKAGYTINEADMVEDGRRDDA